MLSNWECLYTETRETIDDKSHKIYYYFFVSIKEKKNLINVRDEIHFDDSKRRSNTYSCLIVCEVSLRLAFQ